MLINYLFDAKGKRLPLWLIITHAIVFLAVNVLTFSFWYDILALIAAMLFVLSVAQSSAKYYRELYVSNSLVWIGYDFLAGAYGNLVTHIVLLSLRELQLYLEIGKEKNMLNEKINSFLMIGQSNMAGREYIADVSPIDIDLCFILRMGKWVKMS